MAVLHSGGGEIKLRVHSSHGPWRSELVGKLVTHRGAVFWQGNWSDLIYRWSNFYCGRRVMVVVVTGRKNTTLVHNSSKK